MKKIFFLFLSFCSITLVQAQYIDSLKQALLVDKYDTNRVKTILRLSNAYSNFDRDMAMEYAQDALSLSQQNGFKKGEAQSLNIIGSILSGTGIYPKAFEYHLESLKIAEQINNQVLIAALYNNLARVSTERSDFRTALEYLFKAKKLFEQQNNEEYLSDALLNIGDAYERMNQLDSALFFQKMAYLKALDVNYTANLGTIVSNLGSIHLKLGKMDTGITYLRSAVQLLRTSEDEYDKESLAGTYFEISKYFEIMANHDSAVFYAKRSLTLSIEVADQKRILNATKQLTKLYEVNNKVDSAYRYSKMANETREQIFSSEKISQLERMNFEERQRQRDIVFAEKKAKKERKNNLQLFGIALFIINFFVILAIVSRRKAHPKALKYLGLLGLLLLFEFIAVFIHPYIDRWTNHDPVYMLIILVAIGAILVPLHHKLEHWVKEKLAKDRKEKLNKDNELSSQPIVKIREKVQEPIPEKDIPPNHQ